LPTLAELADHLDGVWHGNASHAIFSFSSLTRATPKDIAYYDNAALQDILEKSSAGVVILKAEHQHLFPGNTIVVANPLEAMKQAVQFFTIPKPQFSGIDASAVIHPSAQLGKNVAIGAYTVVGENTKLADGVSIGSNTVIEAAVRIGQNSQINHGVIIHRGSILGSEVVIHSGCIIGASPFNYTKQHGHWEAGFSVGAVIIANQVQIGANSVIDSGALSDTYLGAGVCIDNLVHIGHDVIVGKNTIIAACATLGAFVHIGEDCIIGGASCIAAHVHLQDDIVITGMSTVSKSIIKSGIYSSGTLVHEHRRWRRNAARFKRLDDYIMKLKALEKRV
jgi:UDP-3-O-[3-hydroxymyristoyl] glucosamine N-acyltransferase